MACASMPACCSLRWAMSVCTCWFSVFSWLTSAVTADDEVLFQQRRLLDKQGEPVDAATKVEAGQYSLEAAPDSSADGGGDVTPVVPE